MTGMFRTWGRDLMLSITGAPYDTLHDSLFGKDNGSLENMGVKPDLILVDGNRKPNTGYEEMTLVKGDSKSISIAAASILAKVSRDRYMREIDKKYPEYKFGQHKGYGTKLHYEMIEKYGILPIHRKSFLKKITGEIKK